MTQAEYWDVAGEPLKNLRVDDVRLVDGIWTKHRMTVTNHQTGHTSEFLFTEVDYETTLNRDLFTQNALRRGVR